MAKFKSVVAEKIEFEHRDTKKHNLKLSCYQQFDPKTETNPVLIDWTSTKTTQRT